MFADTLTEFFNSMTTALRNLTVTAIVTNITNTNSIVKEPVSRAVLQLTLISTPAMIAFAHVCGFGGF
jgi:hypothetical protein